MDVETVLQQFELTQGPYVHRINLSLLFVDIHASSSSCFRCHFLTGLQTKERSKKIFNYLQDLVALQELILPVSVHKFTPGK